MSFRTRRRRVRNLGRNDIPHNPRPFTSFRVTIKRPRASDPRTGLYDNGYQAAKEFLESRRHSIYRCWSFDRYVERRAQQTGEQQVKRVRFCTVPGMVG
jgi:hypothetical protein